MIGECIKISKNIMVLKMIQNTKRKEGNMIFSDFYDKDMKK